MSDTDGSTNLTRTASESDGLADTESYRDLLQNKETMYLMKKEIENLVDLRLQEMGISPECKRIPEKTYQKAIKVLKHQTELLKKIIPNFKRTKLKLDQKICRKCANFRSKTMPKLENCTKSNKNIEKPKSTIGVNREIKTTKIKESPTNKESIKNRSSKRKKSKQKTAKPQQNIIKIMCRAKLGSRNSESLILPARRNSVTISNPILFETQDSSSEGEENPPESSTQNIIEELKLNLKEKNERNNKIKTGADEESENSIDTSSPDLKGDEIKIKSKYRINTKVNTSENSGGSSNESSPKQLDKNMTRKKRKSNVKRAKENILEVSRGVLKTRLQKNKSKIRFRDVSGSEKVKQKQEDSQNSSNHSEIINQKDKSRNAKVSQTEKEETEHLEKRIVSIFNVKSPKTVEQSNSYKNTGQKNTLKKPPIQKSISQEPITNSKPNEFDSFESSSEDGIIQRCKTSKELNMKKIKDFPETQITMVLPNVKKSRGETMVTNKLKKVLFDVDDD